MKLKSSRKRTGGGTQVELNAAKKKPVTFQTTESIGGGGIQFQGCAMKGATILIFMIVGFLWACVDTSKKPEVATPETKIVQETIYVKATSPAPIIKTQTSVWDWSEAPGSFTQAASLSMGGRTFRVSITGDLTFLDWVPVDTVVTPPVEPPGNSGFGIGCNTFPWVPLSKFSDIGMKTVRTYCPWHWVYTPEGLFIEPMRQAWTVETSGIDSYLVKAGAKGIDVLLCFNQCPEWIRPTGNGTGGNDYPPIRPGLDRTNPASYSEYAEFFFQLVARYGSVDHPASELRIDTRPQYPNQPINEKKTGLGLIKMVEIGNEWDHWFEGFDSEKYMKPEEQAAMLSACYDAVKRADPNVQVVMGGITDLNLAYLKAMALWASKFRAGGTFPADVINVHHYSNYGNRPGTDKPTWVNSGACLPKDDKAFGQINEIVAWAKSIGKIVYVTEFGADTKAPSLMHIKGSGKSDEDAQAELIVETLKAYKAAGVSAAYVFTAIDDLNSANGGQFQTCGIMSSQATGYTPKPSYFAVKQLINQLKE